VTGSLLLYLIGIKKLISNQLLTAKTVCSGGCVGKSQRGRKNLRELGSMRREIIELNVTVPTLLESSFKVTSEMNWSQSNHREYWAAVHQTRASWAIVIMFTY
jgi:hypothetical protein